MGVIKNIYVKNPKLIIPNSLLGKFGKAGAKSKAKSFEDEEQKSKEPKPLGINKKSCKEY